MNKPDIKTNKSVVPIIYGYTTPEIKRHNGCTKIGDTERDVDERVGEQANTVDVEYCVQWYENAIYAGTMEMFRDYDFHKALEQDGIERLPSVNTGEPTEWFRIEPKEAEKRLYDFRHKRITVDNDSIIPYALRDEQSEAVEKTKAYMEKNPGGEFLWNCKPRFGKTLTLYDFAKKTNSKKILIVTNRPAIANSWYSDYMMFVGRESGYFFVSGTDALKNKPKVVPYSQYSADAKKRAADGDPEMGLIYFVSLQDLKGSMYFSVDGIDKLKEISIIKWDLLVVDEAHEGVDTWKTDAAFSRISRNFTIHLSGTPFNALANEKFKKEAIYNWTYADEQKKKLALAGNIDNPYAVLPKLNMYTYQMSEVIADKLKKNVELNGETEEVAFDLGEFFKVREFANGSLGFVYNEYVDTFLDTLTYKEKYPFSTPELRDELKHTLWMLDRVDSVYALEKKLKKHPVFKDYYVITAVGDGSQEEGDISGKTYEKVVQAIKDHPKTITLSVKQLTTGVTIPEWTAVLMLSNIQRPSLYMQAAFRAQNPCIIATGKMDGDGNPTFKRKENAYVFDFDPARTLTIYEKIANDLNLTTVKGGGTVEQRQNNIRELLNFFPVIGEADNGELVELNAEQVLTIPRKIRSEEVVRRGFMSNFLFNIRNVFNIPKQALDIINQFKPVSDSGTSRTTEIVISSSDGFEVDDDGNVNATNEYVAEKVKEIFGDKQYSETIDSIDDLIDDSDNADPVKSMTESISDMLSKTAQDIIADAQEANGDDMKKSDVNLISNQLKQKADQEAQEVATDYQIQQNILKKERDESYQHALESMQSSNKTSAEIEEEMSKIEIQVEAEYEKKKKDLDAETTERIQSLLSKFEEESKNHTEKVVVEKKEQRRATDMIDDIRDRLRGFSRTIPSFLMAYSDKKDSDGHPVKITLASFDEIVPDEVFKEVTSISLDEFRQLRDGFDYVDEEGNPQHFDGHVFDEVVFDDSVVEFVSLKRKLADYFVDTNKEDIFDYIPPQKTNQIFTPKNVVRDMVEYLEKENPGCYDNPNHTFIDPYMKSGLYITEIVKRLFNSSKMKDAFPDDKERLQHIFSKQVYGLAPTPIIYAISMAYIFGFAEKSGVEVDKSHFVQLDSLPYAKEGTLKEKLDELFPDYTDN